MPRTRGEKMITIQRSLRGAEAAQTARPRKNVRVMSVRAAARQVRSAARAESAQPQQRKDAQAGAERARCSAIERFSMRTSEATIQVRTC